MKSSCQNSCTKEEKTDMIKAKKRRVKCIIEILKLKMHLNLKRMLKLLRRHGETHTFQQQKRMDKSSHGLKTIRKSRITEFLFSSLTRRYSRLATNKITTTKRETLASSNNFRTLRPKLQYSRELLKLQVLFLLAPVGGF